MALAPPTFWADQPLLVDMKGVTDCAATDFQGNVATDYA